MAEHVILVAVVVDADSRKEAEEHLYTVMPNPRKDEVDSWWVAEDERYDRSDNDSAVFVIPGLQDEARRLLDLHGLSTDYNAYGKPIPTEFEKNTTAIEKSGTITAAAYWYIHGDMVDDDARARLAAALNYCPFCEANDLGEMKCPDYKDRCVDCCECHVD